MPRTHKYREKKTIYRVKTYYSVEHRQEFTLKFYTLKIFPFSKMQFLFKLNAMVYIYIRDTMYNFN